MPDDNAALDQEIIRAAYAERVKDAFKVFAENLGMGESEKSVSERFLRALELTRKARDLALRAVSAAGLAEAVPAGGRREAPSPESLSAEQQAIIDQVMSGTTGHRAPPAPPQMGNYRR